MMESLHTARSKGLLHAVDTGFAAVMYELDGTDNSTLALLSALVSHRAMAGDVCLLLDEIAGKEFKAEGSAEVILQVPDAAKIKLALENSSVVGLPGEQAPLILEDSKRLYLGRYWWYERQVADALLARASSVAVGPESTENIIHAFTRLFPESESEIDWQAVAAALALHRKLTVISGGPGTGKTHTVTAIMALLQVQSGDQPLVIKLAAPTGKAAARLTESIRDSRSRIDFDQQVMDALSIEASTLHRLIGIRPGREPRFGPDRSLHADVVVVDEASMIDLPLMAKLLNAMGKDTRLILIGDKNQLASVEAGSVFSDITGSHSEFAYSTSVRTQLEQLTGFSLPQQEAVPGISDSVALLHKSWRFSADSGIGELAEAVNTGDTEKALGLLGSAGRSASVKAVASGVLGAELRAYVNAFFAEVVHAESPLEALQKLSVFRVLCAVRRGPFGMEQMNRMTEQLLRSEGMISTGNEYYQGRPVMVTRNDHGLGLFNGDVGIFWPDAEDNLSLKAWFQMPDNSLRCFSPVSLPAHETTWAMTIHKSQGSEFDQVLLVLPDEPGPVLTRELLYTGITRARNSVEVWADREVLTYAIASRVHRASGLKEKLYPQR